MYIVGITKVPLLRRFRKHGFEDFVNSYMFYKRIKKKISIRG